MRKLTRQLEAFLDEATGTLTQDDLGSKDPEMEMDLRHEIVLCEPLAAVMARQRLFAQARRTTTGQIKGQPNSLDVILHDTDPKRNEDSPWDR